MRMIDFSTPYNQFKQFLLTGDITIHKHTKTDSSKYSVYYMTTNTTII